MPSRLSSTHLPRSTGEVRVAYEESVRIAPCVTMPPRSSPCKVDALELFPVDSLDSVVPRQRTVQECEPAVDDVENAPVFADQRAHKQQRLAAHRVEQLIVDRGEALRIRLLAVSSRRFSHCAAKLSASARPSDRRASAGPALRERSGWRNAPAPASAQQFVVRHAAPQKIGEPRRQFVIVQTIRAARGPADRARCGTGNWATSESPAG